MSKKDGLIGGSGDRPNESSFGESLVAFCIFVFFIGFVLIMSW